MTLEEFRLERGLSYGELADLLALSHRVVAWRYCRHLRMPRRDQMRVIYEATGGSVTPNDFLQVAQ